MKFWKRQDTAELQAKIRNLQAEIESLKKAHYDELLRTIRVSYLQGFRDGFEKRELWIEEVKRSLERS